MTVDNLPPLRLKKHEDRRLRAGHRWVFSNEVDVTRTPVSGFAPGQAVEIQDAQGRVIGTGYVNPHSLICARLVSRDKQHPLSTSWVVHRLKVAMSLRERLYDSPYYRLVYGESDGLPGLVVDRYADILVVQITTAGMEAMKEAIIGALKKVLKPAAVLLRNDGAIRSLENLPAYTEIVLGEIPEHIVIPERRLQFEVSLLEGQKTGWFFDQYENRGWMRRVVPGKRVLDVFSYVGAWGVQAAAAGASQVHCVDESKRACELITRNAVRNNVNDKVRLSCADAFSELGALGAAKERFDVVILDPPAFIKRKKDIKPGINAYHRLNQLAMRVLSRDAILISCSCSYHLSQHELVNQLQRAARHLDRELQILAFGQQAADHPVHPSIPETAYLKAVFARLVT